MLGCKLTNRAAPAAVLIEAAGILAAPTVPAQEGEYAVEHIITKHAETKGHADPKHQVVLEQLDAEDLRSQQHQVAEKVNEFVGAACVLLLCFEVFVAWTHALAPLIQKHEESSRSQNSKHKIESFSLNGNYILAKSPALIQLLGLCYYECANRQTQSNDRQVSSRYP